MRTDSGRSGADAPSGHSAEPGPISVVPAQRASVPNAAVLRAVADKCEQARRGMMLDGAIAVSLGWTDLRSNQGGLNGKPPSLYTRARVPKFSRSTDAALSLIPTDASGMHLALSLKTYPKLPAWALLLDTQTGDEWLGEAQLPAAAICAACLRAYASGMEARQGGDGGNSAPSEGRQPARTPEVNPQSESKQS